MAGIDGIQNVGAAHRRVLGQELSTHLGAVDDTKLKPNSIDAALMVDAYHEFSHPREMMRPPGLRALKRDCIISRGCRFS